jgi:hypothetical protein
MTPIDLPRRARAVNEQPPPDRHTRRDTRVMEMGVDWGDHTDVLRHLIMAYLIIDRIYTCSLSGGRGITGVENLTSFVVEEKKKTTHDFRHSDSGVHRDEIENRKIRRCCYRGCTAALIDVYSRGWRKSCRFCEERA